MPATDVFACRRCGRCCHGIGGIVLAGRDIERLVRYLSLDATALLSRYAERVGGRPRLACGRDGYCILYRDGCGAYEARPDVCRAWPYFRANLADRYSFAMARQDCPGISPTASHEEFVRQGEAYLASQGLAGSGDDVPCALAVRAEGSKARKHGRPNFDAA